MTRSMLHALMIGALVLAGLAQPVRGADLSRAERHHHRGLPGRRPRRHHRPAGFDQARRPPQAELRGGEPRRRRRQHGRQGGGRRGADGYTLLTTTTALAVNHTASKNKGFETSDLRPVAIVAYSPDVLAVHPSNPAKDLKEFIANAKTKSFTYGSAGPGTGAADRCGVFLQPRRQGEIRARAVPGRRAGDHGRARQSRRCASC